VAKAEPDDDVVETPVAEPIKPRSRMLVLLVFFAIVLLEMLLLVWVLPRSPVPPSDETVGPDVRIRVEQPIKPIDLAENPIATPFNCMITEEDGVGYMIAAQITLACETNKKSRYETLYEKVKGQIRDQINVILTSSKITEVKDPNHTVIRNKILLKVNEIFAEPQPLVKEVVIESFNSTPM